MNDLSHSGGVSPASSAPDEPIVIGVDVGSTTVKTVAVGATSRRILWWRYERHDAQQASRVHDQLAALEGAFGAAALADARIFVTGSGAGPLVRPLGAKFVQEVVAVTLAVEALHPNAGSVVELGGQDAKIIIYKQHPETGEKRAVTSMNDKCASGTGATIDRCMARLGLEIGDVTAVEWDDARLHHVAAKCGVFAETDIVNLVKSGIPAREIVCSLADAIVMQNLSVLTRGNTLRHEVVLLGGPNTHLPFLRDCWRQRIAASWEERGHEFPRDVPLDRLIHVPPNAHLYAAFGAAVCGMAEPEGVGRWEGLGGIAAFLRAGRRAGLAADAAPPLVSTAEELEAFRAEYSVPPFEPAAFPPGTVIRGHVGIDGGSTSSKAVLIDEGGRLLAKAYLISRGNPISDTQDLLRELSRYAERQGCTLEILGFGATGYAADILEETLRADVKVVETVAHMLASVAYFGDVDVICDVGGQDIKVLFMVGGDIRNFRLSNQCSAGNGMLLQAMADQYGVAVRDYADIAFKAEITPRFAYGCAVFLDAGRVDFQKEGYTRDEIMAGLARVLPKNIWQYIVQIPRLAELGRTFVLQGGVQYNLAAVKAQVDYIKERIPDARVHVHPVCGEAGALGAALEARRVVEKRGSSTFLGLAAAIGLTFTTKNDDETVCRFCTNHCRRTFIDTRTLDGRTSRYIAGFSCENGTVETKADLKTIAVHRKSLRSRFPNLVDYEAQLAFRRFHRAPALPEAGSPLDDVKVTRSLFGKISRKAFTRGFERSGEAAVRRRGEIRIGIPRVLNQYSTGPMWRTYFETLGIASDNVLFSSQTTEEMWLEGGKYGSVDPCHPAKVAQAHIHELLVHVHAAKKLDYLFFPAMTHVPSCLKHTRDAAACPIVAGTPTVLRVAFTKDVDFFARAGVDYVDPVLTLIERNYFKERMFETWGERLGITRDENDFAVDAGFEALRRFDADLQRHGLEVLETLERENRMGILLLARPYHDDPGLNHEVLEEFQALGYPVLSIRSIPKDEGWLARFFRDDLDSGRVRSPLDINDVWPEGYSTNSAEKVWAAKFAARHPNIAVLDLSSFKCGMDAPSYGLIDKILTAGGTPWLALHDIDANKPAGSFGIRVRTYAYTLARREELLAARAGDRAGRQASAVAAALAAATAEELAEMRAAYADYVDHDKSDGPEVP